MPTATKSPLAYGLKFAKVLLIFIAIVANSDVYLKRIQLLQDERSFLAIFLYVSFFIALVAAVFAMAFIQNAFHRWFWGIISFVSYVIYESHRGITQSAMDYAAFASLIQASGFISEALSQFHEQISLAFVKGTFLFFGIVVKPVKDPKECVRNRNGLLPIVPWSATIFFAGILFVRGGNGANGLPANFPPLAFGSLYAYEWLKDGAKTRRGVEIPHSKEAQNKDIILIVDESVRGDYLDINVPKGIRSGLGNGKRDITIFNYGIAASAANCSHETNITLRYGGTREQYRKIIDTMPSIWEYAKAAGYRTVYVDAQRVNGRLQNGMTKEELKNIDTFIQMDSTPIQQRDMEAESIASKLTRNGKPEFVLINKIGAHFPIQDKYPDEYLVYQPVLARGQGRYEGVSDTGSREGFNGEWDLYKNSYKNTLLWNVGNFFDRLIDHADFENALVIYTSDHGQNFHERGKAGINTHCSSTPSMEEGAVPLVLITATSNVPPDLYDQFQANRNRSSHFNIFPTLLELMGYDRKEVVKIYGTPLTSKVSDPMTFNSKFEARFGQAPDWVTVQPDKVVGP